MKRFVVAFSVLLLVSCGYNAPPNTSTTKVHIRSGGEVVTTYELDMQSKILQSTTRDMYGTAVTRRYSYNNKEELVSVSREKSLSGTATLYLSHQADQGNARLLSSAKSFVDPNGRATQFDLQYLYGADGKLSGIVQTDSNGNVQAKYAKEEEE